ncbi:MAG: SDR family oxidoreductase [Solirubrobacteraceae bacterium]|nr:MAG: short-chain dehydrogenase [Solirubrobacterales bacterium]
MPRKRYSLEGRTVFVTGAARGIGADSARKLAARGANVALVGLEPAELQREAAACGPRAIALEADITDTAALERAVAATRERFGGIDVLIANAGIAPIGTVRTIDPAVFERTIEVNLLGVWRTVRACLPDVIERRGHVLAIASLAAIVPGPGMSAYCASKSGTEAFAKSLRIEVAHLGVSVGVGYFSWIDTDMVRSADSHPVGRFARAKLRGPFGRTYPLSVASDAVVRGVERRSRRVVVPSWITGALVARGLLEPISPLLELGARPIVKRSEAMMAHEIEVRGAAAATAPVGPGGAAAIGVSASAASDAAEVPGDRAESAPAADGAPAEHVA